MALTQGRRQIVLDGVHVKEVLNILGLEIPSNSLRAILSKAEKILEYSVDPNAQPSSVPQRNGLLYGMIQSGKTSIITIATALAADNGFAGIIILTSDIDILYEQTLDRVRKVLRGLNVLGKNDWRDAARFQGQLRTLPAVFVCSKNASKLNNLLNSFRTASSKKHPILIIDDEADQASLNTYTSRGGNQVSTINRAISDIRRYFPVNTYIQVTATPQALFLQDPQHDYRPDFTILSEPGEGYAGGNIFFDASNSLLREVELQEVQQLLTSNQPTPSGTIPRGLKRALLTFLVGAASKTIQFPGSSYAFLCHISIAQRDHRHIVGLIDRFKETSLNILKKPGSPQYQTLLREFRNAYDDLSTTDPSLPSFDEVITQINFHFRGASIQPVNATSSEEIKLNAAYNILVGGNKLGRGVTIPNLLVSYYGRNPRRPNADTVLQHARMYGYRKNTLGVTRLFLPARLAQNYRLIHEMDSALRDVVSRHPEGKFEGLYISSPLAATRGNVLDPMRLGMYVAGRNYNPSYPLRTKDMRGNTAFLDSRLAQFPSDKDARGSQVTIDFLLDILDHCEADPNQGTSLWNKKTIKSALETIRNRFGNQAYLVVRKGRSLTSSRGETQGIISGGEGDLAPTDAPTLFIYRQDALPNGDIEIWWPQLRFPTGNYALAFSFTL